MSGPTRPAASGLTKTLTSGLHSRSQQSERPGPRDDGRYGNAGRPGQGSPRGAHPVTEEADQVDDDRRGEAERESSDHELRSRSAPEPQRQDEGRDGEGG